MSRSGASQRADCTVKTLKASDRRPTRSLQPPQRSRHSLTGVFAAIAVGRHTRSSRRLCCVVQPFPRTRQKSNQPLQPLTSRCCGAATVADGCGAFVYIQHICRSGTPRLPGCHGNWLSNMTAISRRNRRAALAPRVHSQQLNPLGLSPQIIAGGDVKTRSGCWFKWKLVFFCFFLREGRWRRGGRHFR